MTATLPPLGRFFDNHCHLEHNRIPGGTEATLERARAAGVIGFITVGCDAADSQRCIEIAAQHHDVWATVGVHPHEASGGVDGILPLIGQPKVMAIGECGLDYHYDHSPRDQQRSVFAAQIALAHQHQLPLVIHTRSAWEETFDILATEGVPNSTIFHCFTGGPAEARRCLDLGAFLSFSGIVTFPSATDLQDAAKLCPTDRILAETDSPFLAPIPHRGKPNEPAFVGHGVHALASLRQEIPSDLGEYTIQNAYVAFGLAPL
jgi:TatD DNase family protein